MRSGPLIILVGIRSEKPVREVPEVGVAKHSMFGSSWALVLIIFPPACAGMIVLSFVPG